MTDAPSSAAAAPPSDAGSGAAPSPSPTGAAPAVASRPEGLPDTFWDAQANAPKINDFIKDYHAADAARKTLAERAAAVPEKPEGYKVELKLPEGVRLPEGVKFDPAKDPRLPELLKVAHANGISNETVNKLVALDAQFALANHTAETARVAEETKKLGEKATDRIAAVTNWTKALGDKNDFSPDEIGEIRAIASTAAGVTALEKLMAKVNGGIPGHVQDPPTKPPEKPITDRWYGNQQKVS